MKIVECPYCHEKFTENCEYVDVGVGQVQCTANQCPACYASEIGQSRVPASSEEQVTGWQRGER